MIHYPVNHQIRYQAFYIASPHPETHTARFASLQGSQCYGSFEAGVRDEIDRRIKIAKSS
jgi:hypothetical protein